ncbi:MAG TPA: efflux RND transporter permease subunit, partial [Caulobacteraceae bacterium]|nr:efflux RND transporter permease subunit [Caulobacteraceae bacterium]
MLRSILSFGLTRRAIILLFLGLFVAAGLFAVSKLNVEAYPNPAPVILEITAQAPGLSAEEMEKYYTTPMEIALYSTPGVANIRSTSFYGLSFVRVTFKWGVDYYFAYTQAALAMQQNLQLPQNQVPQIQQSSLVGEVYRYQVIGPKDFGLTNLRTVQDWVVARRLMTVPGVAQVNSWGGTTKEFDVQVDPAKIQTYGLTIPQIITALGNANINVGGREIDIGQQSINIRGIGLMDDGGEDNIVDGYKVDDIENVVLTQSNGVPVRVKDVAKVYVGFVPRLGVAGRDHDDDIVAAITVMGRTQHTNDMVPKIKAMVAQMNKDGSLPPGVKVVPYYDRTSLVKVTTHTVFENLIVGCLLVFIVQYLFLGDLRSAIIIGANIPFALLFSIIILVLLHQDANLLSIGAVDFGIIVDSAVILVENIFKNFQAPPEQRRQMLENLAEGTYGPDPTTSSHEGRRYRWNHRLRMIYV